MTSCVTSDIHNTKSLPTEDAEDAILLVEHGDSLRYAENVCRYDITSRRLKVLG